MAAPTRRRVLVVEDDLSIRELLRLHLTLTGFDIDETDDGAEALALTRAAPYDLLILDVMLPGIDGVTVCRAIRAGDANSDTPILMLASRPGVVYTRAALIDQIWSHDSYVTDRTVDAVISRRRRKIERDPHDCELILTAWGVGYKCADSD